MHDIIRYNNKCIYVQPGSKLQDVIGLLSPRIKGHYRITSVTRIPDLKTGTCTWDVTLVKE